MSAPNGVEQFEGKYAQCPMSGCWLWLGRTHHSTGYGQFDFRGTTWQAHRAAWTFYKGPIPDGLDVLHTCDVRCCVNPAHLWLGTHRDNMRDMIEKGRRVINMKGRGPHPNMTEETVRQIRASNSSSYVLAKQLAVSQATIMRVRHRVTWRDVA